MIPLLGKPIKFTDYTHAKVLMHRVGWFGTPGHIKMSYNSADISECDRHALKLIDYGAYGVNHDWYGPSGPNALATLRMLASCERNGLAFTLCVDANSGNLASLSGDAATQEYIRQLQFAQDAYFSSTAYLIANNGYVVNFFNEPQGVNWTTIRKALSAKVHFVFQGSSGFTHPESDGAFGWINPVADPKDFNKTAVLAFTASAAANPTKLAFYPVYSKFDDSMASWGRGRQMSPRLGQTMLDTLALVPKSAEWAILPTLDDQEEGSATEYSQG
jgi:hypothetical protein